LYTAQKSNSHYAPVLLRAFGKDNEEKNASKILKKLHFIWRNSSVDYNI